MMLDLSEIVVRQGMRVKLDVDQPGVEDPDLVYGAPLTGRLTFEHGGDLINIAGSVDTELIVSCDRCLQEVRQPVHLDVDEHLPISDVLHPDRPPREGEETELIIGSVVHLDQGRPILDLDELLRQLLVAERPVWTLCAEECRGLCPVCGANRNEAPCACGDGSQNRPLAALASLLDEPR